MFMFRGAVESRERLARRIRRVLRDRNVMHIGELRMRLGTEATWVQAELEGMVDRGEVERLRPLGYAGEDWDFFRLSRPSTVPTEASDKGALQAVQTGQGHVRLAGEAMACLAD